MTRLLLFGITFYQRLISPYKGFSCAYRVYQGGPSCSEAIRRTLKVRGRQAYPEVRARFLACAEAARLLKAERNGTKRRRGGARPNWRDDLCCCAVSEGSWCLFFGNFFFGN